MPKISKQSAGYVEFEGDYHCEECYKYLSRTAGKACAEVAGTIQPYGGCNTFVYGLTQIEPVRLPRKLSQAEAGYAENKAGFGCRRCEYFDREKWKCEKVEGEIRPYGCCNQWEKSPVFGEI